MKKPSQDNNPYPMLCVRVSPEEKKRFRLLHERLKETNPLLKESDLQRELMSFTSYGIVTNKDRLWLSANNEAKTDDDAIIEGTKRISASKKKGSMQA